MKKLIIIMCAALTACATKPVYIPLSKPCVMPKLPPEPHYPISDLKHGDSPDKVIKAYAATVQMYKDQLRMCKKGREGNG